MEEGVKLLPETWVPLYVPPEGEPVKLMLPLLTQRLLFAGVTDTFGKE